MSTLQPNPDLDEKALRATKLFDRQVRPRLRAEDAGKFVAIDLSSGEFELDVDDYTAVARLRERLPTADVWLARSGFPAACRIGRSR
jgi:hypothetical protein